MAGEPQIVPYLDMPLQHGHPDTLRRMRRPSSSAWVYKTVDKLRAAMPDIALRTTFIVGFPGETEAEFQGLLDFMQAVQFDKLGVFKFSPEPGTPAYDLPNQVAEEVKEERWHRVMAAQQSISLARNQAQVGRRLEVLVEGVGEVDGQEAGLVLPSGQPVTLARSYRDAPEVDGLVLVPGAQLPAGRMATVTISGALAYDLVGELAPEKPTAGLIFQSAAELIVL
jgi:ribosomal protein S12 methylthiotransferase